MASWFTIRSHYLLGIVSLCVAEIIYSIDIWMYPIILCKNDTMIRDLHDHVKYTLWFAYSFCHLCCTSYLNTHQKTVSGKYHKIMELAKFKKNSFENVDLCSILFLAITLQNVIRLLVSISCLSSSVLLITMKIQWKSHNIFYIDKSTLFI